jgi:hypothetical protein
MSEIPFVNQLGDAIETAIAAPQPARRGLFGRRRRLGVLALAVLLAGATGVTVAKMVISSDELAAGTVACYERANLSGGVTVLGTVTGDPATECASAWSSSPAPPLVACAKEAIVAVIPGHGPNACARAGLEPLPANFARSRAKVARLERDVAALEAAADCIPAATLAQRGDALLARSGWVGWRAVVAGEEDGPCGHILTPGGDGRLSLSGVMDADRHEMRVYHGLPRSLDRLLYSEHSLSVRVMDASGERCYTVAELEDLVRRELAVTKRPVGFQLGRKPAETGVMDPRGDRYAEGCAIVVDTRPVYPDGGGIGLEVEIWRKGS